MERTDASTVRWVTKAAIWSTVVAALAAQATEASVDPAKVAIVLAGIAVEVANARFVRSTAVTAAKCVAFVFLAVIDDSFIVLAASAAFDLALGGPIGFALVPVVVTAVVAPPGLRATASLLATVAAIAGWASRRHADSLKAHTAALDQERRSRYRLEETRRRLNATSRDLVRATEEAERTRIAHAIHDDVGHRLTGALMQLQAARRLAELNKERSIGMLDAAITALAETVESVRETVYDLRPRLASGASALRRTCAEFRLCPVTFSLDDDAYSVLEERYRDACLMTIRELLTNAARHSRASAVIIRIDIADHLQLVYRDDGIGSSSLREGLGIAGIRKRIEELGGTVAITGAVGFAASIAIPLEKQNE